MAPKLIVAGGGIGGLSAALALQDAGVDVTVYERAAEFAEIGAGMSLWPNATRILRAWGVLDSVLAAGEPFTLFRLRRSDGRLISTLSMAGFSTPALCIHRADLHRALRAALPGHCLVPNQRLLSFADEPSGPVVAEFADGGRVRADGLIGADGVNSAVRAQLHGQTPPVFRGYCIWRGVAPDRGLTERGCISETWGHGQRFGIMPLGQGRICWYATRNGPAGRPDGPEERKREIQELFARWHDPVRALIDATNPEDIMKNDARDRPALRRWGQGRVTLLGDAAHPITPNVGQGACLAIEDAACLAAWVRREPDLAIAMRTYEARRLPRTTSIGRQARRIGALGQWENRALVAARNIITRLVLKIPHDMRVNPVYAYDFTRT